MKTLSSWFGINRALGSAILLIVLLSAFLALATSTKHTTRKLNSKASPLTTVAPACAASTVFSASFTQGQDASLEVQQQWRDFIQSLTPAGYDTVTISGTFDSTGRTLTDATIVPQIAAAMQNGTPGTWNAGGFTWNVGIGCQHPNAVELNANNNGDSGTCHCTTPGYIVRPDISPDNSNWGGVNTNTCSAPSQTITVTFSGPGPAAAPCATPPSGMVSWWPAEGDGDDIVSQNNLSLGGATFAPGKVNQAFSFGGSGLADAGRPANLINIGGQVTLDGWINPTNTNEAMYFGKSQPFGNDYALLCIFGPTCQLVAITKTGGTEHEINTGYFPPINAWTHVALTYDGSTMTVYANGVNVGSTPVSGTIDDSGESFTIGGRSGGLFFNGLIDEVEVFNRALSGAEVLSIYNAACTGKCRTCTPAPAGMVSWWPGENSGNDVQDGNPVSAGNTNGLGFGAGEVSQAFNFNGTQFASAGNPANLNITGDQVTIDAWVNPSVDMTNEVIFFGKRADGFLQYMLEWENGMLEGRVNNGNVTAVYTPPTGVWTHLALAYNGSANPSVVVYVNGAVLTSSGAQSGNINGTTAPFIIGGTDDGRDFNGLIDEVEVFDRALTQREVQRIYDAGSAGKCPCVTAPNNLIAWWPGDDNPKDIQGSHDATLNGATFGSGEVSDAFGFDGTDDTVSIPDSTDWNFGTGGFTFDFWARATGTSRMYALEFAPVANVRNLEFDFNDTFGLWVYWNSGGGSNGANAIQVGSTGDYTNDQWHHFALTRSGSTWTLYIDGTVAGTASDAESLDLSGASNNYLGAQVAANSDFWNGLIDEVEIFNRALTADEVKGIYNAGGAGKCKPQVTPTPTPTPTPLPHLPPPRHRHLLQPRPRHPLPLQPRHRRPFRPQHLHRRPLQLRVELRSSALRFLGVRLMKAIV